MGKTIKTLDDVAVRLRVPDVVCKYLFRFRRGLVFKALKQLHGKRLQFGILRVFKRHINENTFEGIELLIEPRVKRRARGRLRQ